MSEMGLVFTPSFIACGVVRNELSTWMKSRFKNSHCCHFLTLSLLIVNPGVFGRSDGSWSRNVKQSWQFWLQQHQSDHLGWPEGPELELEQPDQLLGRSFWMKVLWKAAIIELLSRVWESCPKIDVWLVFNLSSISSTFSFCIYESAPSSPQGFCLVRAGVLNHWLVWAPTF